MACHEEIHTISVLWHCVHVCLVYDIVIVLSSSALILVYIRAAIHQSVLQTICALC